MRATGPVNRVFTGGAAAGFSDGLGMRPGPGTMKVQMKTVSWHKGAERAREAGVACPMA